MAFSFGAPATSAQPPATNSLFGQPASNPFGAPAPATSAAPKPYSFGAPPTSSPAAPTSLFGLAAPPAPSPAAGSGGLFGQPAAAPAAGGLFGQPAAAPGAGGFSFGGLGASTAAKPAGLGMFSANQPAPAAAPPAAGPSLTKHHKFNDLPDNVRSIIEGIDASIRSQIQIADQLKSETLGSEITNASSAYEATSAEAAQVAALLAHDDRVVGELRSKVEHDLADVAKATALIEGYKNPQAKGAAAKAVANFPFEYFSRKADEMAAKLELYKTTMDQIQASLSSSLSAPSPSSLLPTLRAQHSSFMALASHVASLDLALRQLKEEYRAIWRGKTGSVQDPFRRPGGEGVTRGVEGIAIR